MIYLIYFLFLPKLTNKNKIDYEKMLEIDYDQKIKNLLDKVGDINVCKDELSSKHQKYYHELLSHYQNILNRSKNMKISLAEKMADIVTFNDAFTHKWCASTNYYQMYLTYQFCAILKKIS